MKLPGKESLSESNFDDFVTNVLNSKWKILLKILKKKIKRI